MKTNDALELHNALVGMKEQLSYVEWLCEQLGYTAPLNDPESLDDVLGRPPTYRGSEDG